jgi:adenylate kinase family enzyme
MKHTILFIGRSGAGKGTQASLLTHFLEKDTPVVYIETGASFRSLSQGDTGARFKEALSQGKLLPGFLAVWAWAHPLITTNDTHTIIFDGVARRPEEVAVFIEALRFYKRPLTVVHLDVSKEWATERVLSRKREDDTIESIEKKHTWFETDTKKALALLTLESDVTIHTINGERSIDEIHKEITLLLNDSKENN